MTEQGHPSDRPETSAVAAPMSLRGAVFLGVGAMVGAGIFALLGQAGAIAGSATWISFLIAGLMSGALGYSMAKLGVRYPSSGGLVTYLIQGFGNSRVVGVASWLGYLTAIVVVGAMVAVSFGDYAAKIVTGDEQGSAAGKAFAVGLLVAASIMCWAGPRLVDRAQSLIVIALLAAFGVFIVATATNLDPALLAPSTYPSWGTIVSSIALTFFAYLGFAVISFSAGDMARPERNLPRAMSLALIVTGLLYVTIALCVFGTLTVDQVVEFGPTAIAEAARPTLGDAGFAIMAVAALLATSSSVTATLYASSGLTGALADSLFPPVFGAGSRLGRYGGMWITTALTILFVTVLGLGALASVGSAVSLAVFVLVAVVAFKLHAEIDANVVVVTVAIAGSTIALGAFVVDLFINDRRSFWAMIVLVALGVLGDAGWKAVRDRRSPPGVA